MLPDRGHALLVLQSCLCIMQFFLFGVCCSAVAWSSCEESCAAPSCACHFFRVHEARHYAPNPIVAGLLGHTKAKPERLSGSIVTNCGVDGSRVSLACEGNIQR